MLICLSISSQVVDFLFFYFVFFSYLQGRLSVSCGSCRPDEHGRLMVWYGIFSRVPGHTPCRSLVSIPENVSWRDICASSTRSSITAHWHSVVTNTQTNTHLDRLQRQPQRVLYQRYTLHHLWAKTAMSSRCQSNSRSWSRPTCVRRSTTYTCT